MDPLTALEMASTGASVLGNLFGGVSSLINGLSQQRAYKAAARQSLSEAGVASNEALISGDEVAARAATQAAANGGGFVGTSLGVIGQASERAMFNARAQTYRGLTASAADLYQGEVARDQGINGLISGIIGGAGAGAQGAASMQFRSDILSSRSAQLGEVSPYDLGVPF